MRILLSLVSLVTLVALPSYARALDYSNATNAARNAGGGLSANNNIVSYIGVLIGALFGLLGVIFLVLTIYAGILWMTAGGNSEQVKKAKQILGNAVIGLILTLASYAISYFVIGLVG